MVEHLKEAEAMLYEAPQIAIGHALIAICQQLRAIHCELRGGSR